MSGRILPVLFIVAMIPIFIEAWDASVEEKQSPRESRRNIHYHSKRHMMQNDPEIKRRPTTVKPRDIRKKPSGHLIPLQDEDMENDEIVSVAIGPPPSRPKYEKTLRKTTPKPPPTTANVPAVNLVKDIFTQLGREFLSRQISEDFVFGQYVGNAMKNLTSELRLNMQHDILELIVKYQKLNRTDATMKSEDRNTVHILKDLKAERKQSVNDTDESWPDFSNLEKIVG